MGSFLAVVRIYHISEERGRDISYPYLRKLVDLIIVFNKVKIF